MGNEPEVLLKLSSWARAMLGRPFVWGETDCAMVCFDALERVIGHFGVVGRYRMRWSSLRGAVRFQRSRGLNLRIALEREGAFVCGRSAMPGDFVLAPHPELPFLIGHVCLGTMVVTSNEERGVYLGGLAEALSQDRAFVMRVP